MPYVNDDGESMRDLIQLIKDGAKFIDKGLGENTTENIVVKGAIIGRGVDLLFSAASRHPRLAFLRTLDSRKIDAFKHVLKGTMNVGFSVQHQGKTVSQAVTDYGINQLIPKGDLGPELATYYRSLRSDQLNELFSLAAQYVMNEHDSDRRQHR
jgi:hypothetical protein